MKLTEVQKTILTGLDCCLHAYISAVEHTEREELERRGYVTVWGTMGGFSAWRITDAGRVALAQAQEGRT